MERPIRIFGTIIAVACSGIIFRIFTAPNSEFSLIIERFQTLIGGIFATVAAAFTAWVVYRSATLPVREAQRREQAEQDRRRRYAAHVLANASRDLAAQLTKKAIDPGSAYRGIVIPADLKNRDYLAWQEPDIIDAVMHLTAEFQNHGDSSDDDLKGARLARDVEARLRAVASGKRNQAAEENLRDKYGWRNDGSA